MHHHYSFRRLEQVSSGALLTPSTPDQQVIDAITDCMYTTFSRVSGGQSSHQEPVSQK